MTLIRMLDRFLAKVEEISLAILLIFMVFLAAIQVLLRIFWQEFSIDWAEPTLQNMTLLLGLLGAALATSEGRHLNIDLLSRVLVGRKKFLVNITIGAFSIFICALLVQGGYVNTKILEEDWLKSIPEGWTAGRLMAEQLPLGEIPEWLSMLMVPVCFSLIGFHFFLRLLMDLGALVTGVEWDSTSAELSEPLLTEELAVPPMEGERV